MRVQKLSSESEMKNDQNIPFSTKFVQQELPALRPIVTPLRGMIILLCFSAFTLVFGCLFLLFDRNVVEVDFRYDNVISLKNSSTVTLDIPKDMEGNIYLKYKLTNFHQNHRRFMTSKSSDQLMGKYVNYDEMSDCSNLRSTNGTEIPETWILPCGLAAVSFFNDTYKISNETLYPFSDEGIAWKSDTKYLFKDLNSKYQTGERWLEKFTDFEGGQTNEHFIVWMRTAAAPTVINLYSICKNCTIPAGKFNITITSNYPNDYFYKGEKHVILTTESMIGAKNLFLGISYTLLSLVLLVVAIALLVDRVRNPRKIGDMNMILQLISEDDVIIDDKIA